MYIYAHQLSMGRTSHGLREVQPFPKILRHILNLFKVQIRIIVLGPRQLSSVDTKLRVHLVESQAGHLGHSDDMSYQVTPVLDDLGLLAQETRLDRMRQRDVELLKSQRGQPLHVLEKFLLLIQRLLAWMYGLDGVVGPVNNMRCLDWRRLASSSSGNEIFLQPGHVDETLFSPSLPEPACMYISVYAFAFEVRASLHGESMETDINPGTVSGEFPVEQSGSQLLMDVTSKRLCGIPSQTQFTAAIVQEDEPLQAHG